MQKADVVSSRARIEAQLRGLAGAPPFVPLVEGLAPKLAGVSWREMSVDSAAWTSGLEQAARLVRADALVVRCERDAVVQAIGGFPQAPETQPHISAAIETLGRLVAMQRARLGCIAVVAGPAVCAAAVALGGSERDALAAIKPNLTRIVEEFAKLQPDLLLFDDDVTHEPSIELRRLYATIRKVANYYGVATGLLGSGEGFAALALDALFVPASAGLGAREALIRVGIDVPKGIALPLPLDVAAAQSIISEARPIRSFGLGFTIEVGADDDLEVIRSIGAAVGALGA